jgi:sugar-specific transcriptional regulator TrmB
MNDMKNTDMLKALGLNPVECRVYLALLESGAASIRQVAEATKINRGTVYEALKSLSARGLVGYNQKGARKRYAAESPDKIYELIEEQKRHLEQVAATAQQLVPGLMAASQQAQGEPVVRFYEDDEGVAQILRDVLATVGGLDVKEYQVFSSRPLRKYLYRRFPSFTQRRIEAGLFVRTIAVGEGGDPAEVSERRWLPEPSAERLSSYVIIYGSKLALISVSADDTPYGVVIDEPGVAAMQRHLFNTLWSSLG